MCYAEALRGRLPEELHRYAGTIETLMLESFRTLDGVPTTTFDRYAAEAVRVGPSHMERLRKSLVADGMQSADC